jgi:hypothetical protein
MTKNPASAGRHRVQLRRRFAKLLLILGGILVGLAIAEVALRISSVKYFNAYIADPDFGYSLRPGAEGWWRREALTYVRINSHGFRDREHTIAKPPGTLRIAVIGDSYVEAFQVPLEKGFWSVMERKLPECPRAAGSNVEVLSFGVSGFSTASELILLQKRVWQYAPDIIVLLVTTGNDIRDNSRALTPYGSQPRPYFVSQNGKLVLDDSILTARNDTLIFRLHQSWIGKSFNWLQSHVRLMGLIYAAREAYQSSAPPSRKNTGSANEPGLADEVYRKPDNPDWEDAWRVTEELMVQMREEVQARGARFLVVTGSSGIQDNPDPAVRQQHMTRLGVRDLFYPDQRIKALGEHEGFKVLNLAPAFQDYASRNGVFLHGAEDAKGKGHWNEMGHRLAGELIAEELCREGL